MDDTVETDLFLSGTKRVFDCMQIADTAVSIPGPVKCNIKRRVFSGNFVAM